MQLLSAAHCTYPGTFGKTIIPFCQILLLQLFLINLRQTVFRLPSLFGFLSREDMDVLRFNILSLSTI